MQSKIFLAAVFLASLITMASTTLASIQVSATVLATGETTITTSTSAGSGTLDTTFRNTGVSAYSSSQETTTLGFTVANSFVAVGKGSYSASSLPTTYKFVPKNVPNPTWKVIVAGSATYIQ